MQTTESSTNAGVSAGDVERVSRGLETQKKRLTKEGFCPWRGEQPWGVLLREGEAGEQDIQQELALASKGAFGLTTC